jgi:hypothetical protein
MMRKTQRSRLKRLAQYWHTFSYSFSVSYSVADPEPVESGRRVTDPD